MFTSDNIWHFRNCTAAMGLSSLAFQVQNKLKWPDFEDRKKGSDKQVLNYKSPAGHCKEEKNELNI